MIDRLTHEEKHALLELMACLSRADGRVNHIERELLSEYADLFHIQLADVVCDCGADSLETLAAQFQRPESRIIVLQELLRLAHLDGFFNKNEKSLILDAAVCMGVPPEFLKKIDDWVLSGIEWTLQGEQLLDEAASAVLMAQE